MLFILRTKRVSLFDQQPFYITVSAQEITSPILSTVSHTFHSIKDTSASQQWLIDHVFFCFHNI